MKILRYGSSISSEYGKYYDVIDKETGDCIGSIIKVVVSTGEKWGVMFSGDIGADAEILREIADKCDKLNGLK